MNLRRALLYLEAGVLLVIVTWSMVSGIAWLIGEIIHRL